MSKIPADCGDFYFSSFFQNRMNKKYIFIIILTILGMINAFYLSYEAYSLLFSGKDPIFGNSFCDINATFSCTNFLSNPRSLIFGIPFPMIAAVVYPLLFILAIIGYQKKSIKIAKIITLIAVCWLLFNGYVISQEFMLGAFCPLCLMCTGYILLIAFTGLSILKNTGIHISR